MRTIESYEAKFEGFSLNFTDRKYLSLTHLIFDHLDQNMCSVIKVRYNP